MPCGLAAVSQPVDDADRLHRQQPRLRRALRALGQRTAVAMNALMALQTVVAIWILRWPQARLTYYALMPVIAAACIVTWQGAPSLLSTAATTLSTIGRMQSNETRLRALLLASTPFWAAHDLAVGSLPGLLADLLSTAIGAVMLRR